HCKRLINITTRDLYNDPYGKIVFERTIISNSLICGMFRYFDVKCCTRVSMEDLNRLNFKLIALVNNYLEQQHSISRFFSNGLNLKTFAVYKELQAGEWVSLERQKKYCPDPAGLFDTLLILGVIQYSEFQKGNYVLRPDRAKEYLLKNVDYLNDFFKDGYEITQDLIDSEALEYLLQ
ncbi:unnamed protein product, partial [marine sediment metagenome]